MGAPAMEFTDPDGSRQLVYPKGPLGTDTLMVYLGKDGVLRDDVRNVLTDQTFESVKAGLTEKDIQRLIGPPAQVIPFALSNTHAWDYRYMDTWGYLAIFSVTFDANGIVVSKSKARINDGKSRGM